MIKKNLAGFLIFALTGACLTTFCDAIHVRTQTLSYPDPFLFGQAGWVYPGFALAFLFMEYTASFAVDRLPASISTNISKSPGRLNGLIESATLFAFVYLLSGFGNFEPVLLSLIFYGTFVARLMVSYDRLWLLILAVSMAVGGMFVEGLLSAAELVTYRHADIFHVPWWLGGLYVHGAFALREGLRFFVYKSSPPK